MSPLPSKRPLVGRRAALVVAALTALSSGPLAGCATARVDFTASPPLGAAHPEDARAGRFRPPYATAYREVRERWTRRAMIIRDWDTALDARITLASREMRAAYVRMLAGMRKLPDTTRAELAARQEADASAGVELWVPMETSRWEWNDLASSRTVWTITLGDDEGREVESTARAQLEAKAPELDQLFSGVGPFTLAWKVRFPDKFADGTPVLRPGLRRLTARFSGPLGQTMVTWESQ